MVYGLADRCICFRVISVCPAFLLLSSSCFPRFRASAVVYGLADRCICFRVISAVCRRNDFLRARTAICSPRSIFRLQHIVCKILSPTRCPSVLLSSAFLPSCFPPTMRAKRVMSANLPRTKIEGYRYRVDALLLLHGNPVDDGTVRRHRSFDFIARCGDCLGYQVLEL